jgi:hypothetical protein
MNVRGRVRPIGVVGALVLLAALTISGSSLAASPIPGPVGSGSPAPSGAIASPAESGAPGQGFATPDEAVKAYLAGVAANDFDAVLATCAIQQMATGYRFDIAAPYYSIIDLSFMWAPATNTFYQQVNAGLATGQITRTVLDLSYSLLLANNPDFADLIKSGSPIAGVDAAKAQAFATAVDPSQLTGLSVIEVRFPKASIENDPRTAKNFATRASIYSADEWTERVALVTLDGQDYVVGFGLVRYGSDWFVAYPNSSLYGTPTTGVATPITQEEFDTTTSS